MPTVLFPPWLAIVFMVLGSIYFLGPWFGFEPWKRILPKKKMYFECKICGASLVYPPDNPKLHWEEHKAKGEVDHLGEGSP